MGKMGAMAHKVPCAIRSPSIADIAFAAGFLQGEGSFLGPKMSHNSTEHIAAPQIEVEPLARLQEIFGGTVGVRVKGRPVRYWRATGARARGVMMTIYTFMSPKRRAQIRRALGQPEAEGMNE